MKYTEEHLSQELVDDQGMNEQELLEMKEAGVDEETLLALSPKGRDGIRKTVLHYANLLHPTMKVILDQELKLGNRISDASDDYPDKGSINVTISKKFKGQYQLQGVQYTQTNDPYYWFEDYMMQTKPRHLILH